MKTLLAGLLLHILVVPASLQSEKQRWVKLSTNVDIVLVAEVEEVGPSPGFWSGFFAASQEVRFKLVKVLKGQVSSRTLKVEYYLVKNDELADIERPRLSPKIFKVGNKLVLFLKLDPKKNEAYFTADSNRGTVKADADIMKALSNLNSIAR